jgi:hypothetical protein
MNFQNSAQKKALDLISGFYEAEDFQNWLQENLNSFDQTVLDFSLPLLEFDLCSNEVRSNFQETVKDQYLRFFGSKLDDDRAKNLLQRIVSGEGDIVAICHELARLFDQGVQFIPVEFKGFSSELDDVPLEKDSNLWSKSGFIEKREKISLYLNSINELASKALLSSS